MFTDIEDILKEVGDDKVNHRVRSTIQKYQDHINALSDLPKKQRIYFLDLLLKDTKKKIKKAKYEHSRVHTFLLNKIQALYRNELNIRIQQLPQDYDLSLEEKENRTHKALMAAIKAKEQTYYNSVTENVEVLPAEYQK